MVFEVAVRYFPKVYILYTLYYIFTIITLKEDKRMHINLKWVLEKKRRKKSIKSQHTKASKNILKNIDLLINTFCIYFLALWCADFLYFSTITTPTFFTTDHFTRCKRWSLPVETE